MKPIYVNKIVRATCCLHNFLKSDSINLLTEIIEDERNSITHQNGALQNLRNVGGAFARTGYDTREKFKNYFSSPIGSVKWQFRVVHEGRQHN